MPEWLVARYKIVGERHNNASSSPQEIDPNRVHIDSPESETNYHDKAEKWVELNRVYLVFLYVKARAHKKHET